MKKFQSLTEIQSALANRQLSMVDLVQYYLSNIETTKHLNAYVEIYEAAALDHAKQLDAKYKDNPETVGRLFGMVISIKDVLCYKGHQVTAASKILEGFTSLFTATAIQRLLDEDAIIIGRVNCDQFAMGSTNENSVYGPVLNPIDNTKVPGGSSGGSAVSVKSDTCLASIGTDTGGSVRQPAAFCDLVGIKPTYGRVSRYGLLAYASSFDQIGVLSHTVRDAALILEVMAGEDEMDSTSSQKPVESYSTSLQFERKAKIAYFDTALEHEGIHPEIKSTLSTLIQQLEGNEHEVQKVSFEYLDYIIPAYYVLTTAEASSNLSRYDGVRFGYRNKAAKTLEEVYRYSRTEGFSPEVKRRIMLGTFVLSSGYYDAYYTKAQKARQLIQQKTLEILQDFDYILMPISPTPPWNLGENADDPVAMYLSDIFTVQANMVGIPAVSLPLGYHSNGLPIGVQFMANRFEEASLFAFSEYIFNNYCS